LLGNINGPNLFRLKLEHITKLCHTILTEQKEDHRFILATSAADVAYDTPLENIKAMVDSVKDFK
jgi:uroporphyrinogen-III decarboxylase